MKLYMSISIQWLDRRADQNMALGDILGMDGSANTVECFDSPVVVLEQVGGKVEAVGEVIRD